MITFFVALCFTEFSMRLPKAGSVYFYSYATIGELCGFIVGWTMILEHTIGVAIAAKAWSQYLGHISNNSLPKYSALINPFIWLKKFNQVFDRACWMLNICNAFWKYGFFFKVVPLEMLSNTCPSTHSLIQIFYPVWCINVLWKMHHANKYCAMDHVCFQQKQTQIIKYDSEWLNIKPRV